MKVGLTASCQLLEEELHRRQHRVILIGEEAGRQERVDHRCGIRNRRAATVREFGRLDIVYNNAGVGSAGSVADATEENWDRCFDVNVKGTWSRRVRRLKRRGRPGGVGGDPYDRTIKKPIKE